MGERKGWRGRGQRVCRALYAGGEGWREILLYNKNLLCSKLFVVFIVFCAHRGKEKGEREMGIFCYVFARMGER